MKNDLIYDQEKVIAVDQLVDFKIGHKSKSKTKFISKI